MTHDLERIWDVLIDDAINAPTAPDILARVQRGIAQNKPALQEDERRHANGPFSKSAGRRWPTRARLAAEALVVTGALALVVWVLVGKPEDIEKRDKPAVAG